MVMAYLQDLGTSAQPEAVKFFVRDLNLFYGPRQALKNVNLVIPERRVTALIGPSGCGKSSFLRCLNRMNELNPLARISGSVQLDNQDIYAPEVDVVSLRARVGMVFQKPSPFPQSIYDNVAYGPRIHRLTKSRNELDALVVDSLQKAGLYKEVADILEGPAMRLSGGQQQRLCIARAIAVNPDVILMDEPCSALDPVATAKVEELIDDLRSNYTIVIVTHNMQQAGRVAQKTAFFHMGELVESGDTGDIFTNPKDARTQGYLTGRFG